MDEKDKINQLLFELGFSIRFFLYQLQRDDDSIVRLLSSELIENIIDKTEEETGYRSKSQIMNFLHSSKHFIFKINNEYLLEKRYVDGDKFRFYCINLKDFMITGKINWTNVLLFRICRKFIKIYSNGKLLAKMNKFFTIRKLNRFEPSSLTGRITQKMILDE